MLDNNYYNANYSVYVQVYTEAYISCKSSIFTHTQHALTLTLTHTHTQTDTCKKGDVSKLESLLSLF